MVEHDLAAGPTRAENETRLPTLDDRGNPKCNIEDEGHTGMRELELQEAASHGRYDHVKSLLESGDVDPDFNKARSRTPLCIASKNGHLEVVRLLMDSGRVNLGARGGHDQRDAISYAAGAGHNSIVDLLCDRGVSPDVPDREGRTPLSRAAGAGHEKVVERLVNLSVTLNLTDKYGRTPFWHAAAGGHAGVCNQLIATGQVKVDSEDCEGQTPFEIAVLHGYVDVVKIFLDPSRVDQGIIHRDGAWALHEAVRQNNEAMVRCLICSDIIPIDHRDDEETPFGLAVNLGYSDIARVLAQTGKVDMVPTYEYVTFLDMAVQHGRVEMIRLLLEYDQVDPNEHSILFGGTPLTAAAGMGNVEIVQLLLDTGRVDPNSRDVYDRTPLINAVYHGRPRMVDHLLLIPGLDIEAKDREGMTALACAAQEEHNDCVRLLLQTGRVDVNTRDRTGRTPLSLATEKGHSSTVRLLLNEGGADASLADVSGDTAYDWALRMHRVTIAAILSSLTT